MLSNINKFILLLIAVLALGFSGVTHAESIIPLIGAAEEAELFLAKRAAKIKQVAQLEKRTKLNLSKKRKYEANTRYRRIREQELAASLLKSKRASIIKSKQANLGESTHLKYNPNYKNTNQKGMLGDAATAKRMTGMGYKKLDSKLNSIHGIDGVYKKNNINGEIEKIVVVENKVDKAQLRQGTTNQMSKEWIYQNIDKLETSKNPKAIQTGRLLSDTIKNNPEKVEYQMWHHDTESSVTKVYNLDGNGQKNGIAYEFKDNMLNNMIEKYCVTGKLNCEQLDN